ncbi:hypothetical protein IX95_14945 [Vibrio sp. B183]|uniref:AAA domain-containing protein n=1 Tax=Vibrio sp. B183 TaxID=1526762 RepID=UPI00050040BC|nr:AAA domain-containing protein [Vibrio sp. B183]KFI11371.1 hypothetical protein IX95_14945 [Vibrio sp. B183]
MKKHRYLNLLKNLCTLPKFEDLQILKGTRHKDVLAKEIEVHGVFNLPDEPRLLEEFIKKTTAKNQYSSKPPIYIVYQLFMEDLNEAIPFLAIPTTIDRLDTDASFCSLKPALTLPILFNSSYLRHKEKPTPDRVLGDAEQYTQFRLKNPPPETDSWSKWHDHGERICQATTGVSIDDLAPYLAKRIDTECRLDVAIASFSAGDTSSIKAVLELYESLDASNQQSPLLAAISAHEQGKPTSPTQDDTLAEDILTHPDYLLGHMDEQLSESLASRTDREMFALDNSQRLVVHKLSQCLAGDALAVNGPPGSGKTAMLKAVVANQWVLAAWQRKPCPITIAVGATNQSVTNVIGAFPKVLYQGDENPDSCLLHFKRWIPHAESYGTYFPSSSEREKINESGRDNDYVLGAISKNDEPSVFCWQGKDAPLSEYEQLASLKSTYQEHACAFFQEDFDDMHEKIVDACHKKLSVVCEAIVSLLKALPRHKRDINWLYKVCKVYNLVPDIQAQEAHSSREQAHQTAGKLLTICGNDRKAQVDVLSEVLRERISDNAIILSSLPDRDFNLLCDDAFTLLFDRLLDVTLRPEAFHLAARYWEGVYLSESSSSLLISRTEANVEQGLRRLSMLTPCLVATLNTAPRLFALQKASAASKQHFLLGQADLLIMDESGQAQQRLAMPLLSLAKNALVVGDVDQLQPVITDVSLGDEAYAYSTHGYSNKEFMHAYAYNMTTGRGSMLSIMRRASRFSHQGHGLMLRGHYRCQTNIIQFCNEVVYDNKLMFLPHNSKERGPLHSFSWVNSDFKNARKGTSRYSVGEAKLIAEFILKKWEEIFHFYREKDQKKNKPVRTASELIAIVTPFKAQAEQLKKTLIEHVTAPSVEMEGLDKCEVEDMVIGTVDSLQGAEKPIVIFSGVHGASENGTPYFDEQPFLLNVAVSRAQDCFVAFICEKTYGVGSSKQLPIQEKRSSARSLGYYLGHAEHEPGGLRRCTRLFPKRLVIIEAAGKKKVLSEYLGQEYLVLDTQGSITEYEESSRSLEYLFKSGFKPRFKLREHAGLLLSSITEQAPMVDEIILATDADYVGETIAWHLYMQFRDMPDVQNKMTRVRLGAMTKETISEAFDLQSVAQLDKKVALLGERERQAAICEYRTTREKINHNVVRAELFRELADTIITALCRDIEGSNEDKQLKQRLLEHELISPQECKIRPEAMGRVRLGILDILLRDAMQKHQIIDKGEPKVVLTAAGREINGKLTGTCKDSITTLLGKLASAREKTGTMSIAGDPGKWRFVHPSESSDIILPAPGVSTMEVIRYAHKNHKLEPATTMRILQALYMGDF